MKSNDRFSKAVCRKVAWYLYLILLSPSIFAVQGFNTQCPRGGKRRGLRGKGTSICMGHGCLSSLSGVHTTNFGIAYGVQDKMLTFLSSRNLLESHT